MQINIPYGSDISKVDIPDSNIIAVVEPESVDRGECTIPRLPFSPDLIIVNDASRPTPTEEVLDGIYDQLPTDAKYLIATGTHRAPTYEELQSIFGKYLDYIMHNIIAHDARDDESMEMFGVTSRGTDVMLNKLCIEAEKILVIGSVEPHYFAGYSGGRKAFMPGTCGYRSIEQNHRHALDPASMPLALEGNPVHEDCDDAMELLKGKDIHSIQLVLDRYQEIYGIAAGNMKDSFQAAVKLAEKVCVVPVKEKADIVVAVAGAPLDATLYQAHKAIENTKSVMKEGGVMILVAACGEGMGNDAFVKLLSESNELSDIVKAVKAGYKLGYHKSSKLAELMMGSEVWVVSDLSDADIDNIFMKPFNDVQAAINAALKLKGSAAKVLLVQDACVTVPRLA